MLIQREWRNEPEVFEAIAEVLGDLVGCHATVRDEEGSYGEQGYITIHKPDGRRFRLELSEER